MYYAIIIHGPFLLGIPGAYVLTVKKCRQAVIKGGAIVGSVVPAAISIQVANAFLALVCRIAAADH